MTEAPTFGRWLAAQRGKRPGARVPWTAMEDAQLKRELAEDVPWKRIALHHGRSVGAVRQRARKVAGGE
jgi:hypothetical protein